MAETPQQAVTWVQILMSVSLVLFYAAYFYRKRVKVHLPLALGGVLFNLIASMYLLAELYIYGKTMTSDYPEWLVQVHRAVATLVLLMMLYMAYTGIRRKRKQHIALHKVFIISYTIIYISGWILFVR